MAEQKRHEDEIGETIQSKTKAQGIAFVLGTLGAAGVTDDLRRVEKVFIDQLNFAVHRRESLTAEGMKALIQAAAVYPGYPKLKRSYQYIVVYFAGHGGSDMNGDSFVQPREDEGEHGRDVVYTRKDIIKPFEGRLEGKKKLFFFDCCSSVPKSAPSQPKSRESFQVSRADSIPDSLVAYASSFGERSLGKAGGGGIWTSVLCKYLVQDLTLSTILDKVSDELKGKQLCDSQGSPGTINLKASAKLPTVDLLKKPPKPDHVFKLLRNKANEYDGFAREFRVKYSARKAFRRSMDDDDQKLDDIIRLWTAAKTEEPASAVTWEFLIDTVLMKGMELRRLAAEVKAYLNTEEAQQAYCDLPNWVQP